MSTTRESETKDYRTDALLIGILFAWAFFVNRQLKITGYYMDDLYMWSCWGEQSFLQYVFPFGSTRCRFVYWLAAWAELLIVGNHIDWVVPLNILLNGALAAFLYCFGKKLSRSRIVGFWVGFLFLSSQFSYYQIGQLLGLMETMGIFFAAALCMYLYRYLRGERKTESFALALLFYFLNCFTHERYMVLLPMFFFCLLLRREKKMIRWILPAAVFAAVLAIRFFFIGSLSPAGTGGTQIADTITGRGVVVNFFTEFLYLLGVNLGPEHLCGLPWSATPFLVKILILFRNLLLPVFLVMVWLDVRQLRRYRRSALTVIRDSVFFLGFMIGCAAASAVTIRVEMRWVYSVYTFMLLLAAMLFGARREVRLLRDANPEEQYRYSLSDNFPLGVLAAVALLTVPLQLYWRTYYPKIYLFPNQSRYNSLADVTYGTYGKEILGKEIIIIGNTYEMSDFTAETFFKTFDPERTGQGTTVRHVDSVLDFGQVTENMIVLKEDPAHDRFTDATDIVRSLKLGIDYGYYRDGWMDESARIHLMTGESGEIRFHVMYPGNLTGTESITVLENGTLTETLPLTSNEQDFVLKAAPRQIANLDFRLNFFVENAAEQRGEDRLAAIVTFTAE